MRGTEAVLSDYMVSRFFAKDGKQRAKGMIEVML